MWVLAMLCRAVLDEVRLIRSDCCRLMTVYDPQLVLQHVDPTHDITKGSDPILEMNINSVGKGNNVDSMAVRCR